MTSLPTRLLWFVLAVVAGAAGGALCATAESLSDARRLWLRGRYDEARRAYEILGAGAANDQPDLAVSAAIGAARCRAARGQSQQALDDLKSAGEHWPVNADLLAESALLEFEKGNLDSAAELAEQSLALDPHQLRARWIRAELFRVTGRLQEAESAYRWFVDHYNEADDLTAEEIYLVGRAAARYAAWNGQSDQYTMLVNDLFPSALRKDAAFWPAQLEIGRLFAEKYNDAAASEAFAAASELNPHAPEVLAARARLALSGFELTKAQRLLHRALRINPEHVPSHLVLADLHFASSSPHRALDVLNQAREFNPVHEPTLGRLATAYQVVGDATEQVESLTREVAVRNPSAGDFYAAMGASFDLCRKYPDAARCYALAVESAPRLPRPHGQLGLMQMRLGQEDDAREALARAFEIDPFNVRVRNSLEVLDVLQSYSTIETQRVRIRFDPQYDSVLARCAARYLDETYPELCERLGYELREPALFEIFNQARNTDGQGWFSARMVGLPNLHLVAACAGQVVAMASPNGSRVQIDWARTLRHEMVHVFNLQQTDFNVPHWFTEAVAVRMEDQPRHQEWNELLVRRVPAGQVYDLDTINVAFVNPGSADNWQMAYCQAETYAEYLVERYGADALQRMLAAYCGTSSTGCVLKECFDVDQPEFERGYREYLRQLVTTLRDEGVRPVRSFHQLKSDVESDAEDLDTVGELALAFLRRRQYDRARPLIERVLAADALHPLGILAKSRLLLVAGEDDAATTLLLAHFDEKNPQPAFVQQLVRQEISQKHWQEAERLAQLGADRWPRDPTWARSLAIVALEREDTQQSIPLLEQVATADDQDVSIRRKLAVLSAQRGDHEKSAHWATQVVHRQVNDAAMHRLLAESLLQLGDAEAAEFHQRIVTDLQPAPQP